MGLGCLWKPAGWCLCWCWCWCWCVCVCVCRFQDCSLAPTQGFLYIALVRPVSITCAIERCGIVFGGWVYDGFGWLGGRDWVVEGGGLCWGLWNWPGGVGVSCVLRLCAEVSGARMQYCPHVRVLAFVRSTSPSSPLKGNFCSVWRGDAMGVSLFEDALFTPGCLKGNHKETNRVMGLPCETLAHHTQVAQLLLCPRLGRIRAFCAAAKKLRVKVFQCLFRRCRCRTAFGTSGPSRTSPVCMRRHIVPGNAPKTGPPKRPLQRSLSAQEQHMQKIRTNSRNKREQLKWSESKPQLESDTGALLVAIRPGESSDWACRGPRG